MNSNESPNHVYIVLGMARSGTSAMTRGLKALGVDLGTRLLPANEKWGKTGLWEEAFVHKINRDLTERLGQPLIYLRETEFAHDERQSIFNTLGETAKNLMKRRLDKSKHWAFKDPRTPINLLFWQNILKSMHVEEHYLIALRNPLSSANSYHHVSGCDLEVALLSWLMHNIAAIEGTKDKNRVIVDYSLLMQDPPSQLKRIKSELHIPDLADQNEIDAYAQHFLDRKLTRFEHTHDDLKNYPIMSIAPLCLRVYELLYKVANDEIKFTDTAFTQSWQSIMQDFESDFPLYCYLDSLLQKNKILERMMRHTTKSLFWRLFSPLRWCEDGIRSSIRRFKEQRKLKNIYES